MSFNIVIIKATNVQLLLFSLLSCVQLFAAPWAVTLQAPLLLGFPRQEYWSELPFPSPGDLPDPGSQPRSPSLVDGFFTPDPPGKPKYKKHISYSYHHRLLLLTFYMYLPRSFLICMYVGWCVSVCVL